jgi:hypothetical protein
VGPGRIHVLREIEEYAHQGAGTYRYRVRAGLQEVAVDAVNLEVRVESEQILDPPPGGGGGGRGTEATGWRGGRGRV